MKPALWRKGTAAVMAAALLFGTPLTATAWSEEELVFGLDSNVISETEGVVELAADIFSVSLPVTSETGKSVFDFIMDPQQVIAQTDGASLDGAEFDGGTLYFTNLYPDGSLRGYSGISDALTITNRSTVDVEVTVEAYLELPEKFPISEDPTFANDYGGSIYMAVVDNRTETPITAEGISFTTVIPAAAEDAYISEYDEDLGYSHYELSDEAMDENYRGFSEYSFCLTGACHDGENWRHLKFADPVTVTVTWSVTPAESLLTDEEIVELLPEEEEIEEEPIEEEPLEEELEEEIIEETPEEELEEEPTEEPVEEPEKEPVVEPEEEPVLPPEPEQPAEEPEEEPTEEPVTEPTEDPVTELPPATEPTETPAEPAEEPTAPISELLDEPAAEPTE